MSNSRLIVSKRSIIFFSMAVFVSLGTQGYSGFEDEQSSVGAQSSWRMKRKSQISCHCCSHSFNSHCCLQCMNRLRIGKRAPAANLNDANQLPDTLDELVEDRSLGEFNAQQDDLAELVNQDLLCTCCLRLMDGDPFPQRWPCCRKCQALFGPTKSDTTAGNLV